MRTKRASEVNKKAFFIIFKTISFAKKCLRHESAPLTLNKFHSLLCCFNCWFEQTITGRVYYLVWTHLWQYSAFKFNCTTHFRAMFRFWFPWKHPGGIEWPEMGSMMSVTSFWLTLNRFYRFFWCFHCWLWTSKYRLAYFRFLVRVGKKLK